MSNPLKVFGLAIVISLLAAACSSSPVGTVNESDGVQQPAGTNQAAELAPDIEITLYQGGETIGTQTIRLSDLLANGQPVVLNFWAGLCPPCRIEMPDLERVYQNHSGEFFMIGVDVGPFTGLGSRDEGRALLQELGVTYPIGTTFDEKVLQDFEVLGMPSTYFITADGTIHETWAGLLTEEKLEELVEDLLATSEAG